MNGKGKPIDDLISRQAAIDALGEEPPVWYDGEDEIAERNQWRRDVTAIKELPSAQPSVSKTEIVEDCISRQAAIDALILQARTAHRDGAISWIRMQVIIARIRRKYRRAD